MGKNPDRDRDKLAWLYVWTLPIGSMVLTAVGTHFLSKSSTADTDDSAGSSRSGTDLQSSWFTVGLLLIVVAIVLTVIVGKRTLDQATRSRASVATYNHLLGDTIRALDRLLESDRGQTALDVFFQTVVSEAKALVSVEQPRVCVYALEQREVSEDAVENDGYFLRLVAFGGRSDRPRDKFTENTDWGRDAVTIALGTKHRVVDDVENPPFITSDPKRRLVVDRDEQALWKSFLLVPLRDSATPAGLLTIDTTKQTTFSNDHIAVAMTIASLLEIGMKGVAGAAEDTKPEMSELLSMLGTRGPLRNG